VPTQAVWSPRGNRRPFIRMTSRSLVTTRLTLYLLPALLVAFAIGVLIPLADSRGQLPLFLGGFLALAVVGALFAAPLRYLPGLALLVALLVPTELSSLPHELQGASLGILPLAIWIIRAPRSTRIPAGLSAVASLFGVWLILSLLFAPLRTNKGLEWLFTVGLATVFAVVSAPEGLKAPAFRALFLNIATILGVYALLEGFILHHNILFGPIFEHTSWWATQRLSASYRVTTLLGHPLVNGLIFATASVLSASDLARRSRRTLFSLARFVILIGATDAAHSRGATISLAVGVLVVIIFSRTGGKGWATRRLVLVMGLFLGAAVLVYGLQARDESRGGRVSAEVRVAVITRASEAVHDVGAFGAGPGESEAYRRSKRLPGWQIDLENSYAQLAVSLGVIGALLLSLLLIAVVVVGLKNDLVTGEAAALLAILVDISGFNAIEGHPNVGVVIMLFVIAIITAPRSAATVTSRHKRTQLDVGRSTHLPPRPVPNQL
jgi:hypothetical protein